MTASPEAAVRALVARQLERIVDPERRAALAARLVAPVRTVRGWAYGPQSFECWIVARDEAVGVELLYCGAAPLADPWGCAELDATLLGMDSQWFRWLDDAFIASMWKGPRPPGYEVE